MRHLFKFLISRQNPQCADAGSGIELFFHFFYPIRKILKKVSHNEHNPKNSFILFFIFSLCGFCLPVFLFLHVFLWLTHKNLLCVKFLFLNFTTTGDFLLKFNVFYCEKFLFLITVLQPYIIKESLYS